MMAAAGSDDGAAALGTEMLAALTWGDASWARVAVPAALVLLAALAWGYWRAGARGGLPLLAAALKAVAIALLAACLLEPLFTGSRPRPGANLFVVLIDNSRSMTLRDRDAPRTRGEEARSLLRPGPTSAPAAWLTKVKEVFDLREYAFDGQLRPATDDFAAVTFDGSASDLAGALDRVARQYQGRPLAGVIVLTDGNATDADRIDDLLARAKGTPGPALPPIYPVLIGGDRPADDVALSRVTVSQTNFEDAPVTLTASVGADGFRGRTIVAELLDESGKSIERQSVKVDPNGQPAPVRFQLRPEQAGVSFYRIRVAADGRLADSTPAPGDAEATIANNTRLFAVDRGKGPYRVLYVGGRPNWEFKFLQRALQGDDQVELVGLMRVAKREPKFNYLSRADERSNPLFRGFKGADEDQVEQYDQPVLVRLGTKDPDELRGGFPRTAEELFAYHAIVLDDLESEFFTQEQMLLLKNFVAERGGGLLMLGGQESLAEGKYDRTPVGDVLPVYATTSDPGSTSAAPTPVDPTRYRLALTREGWLEPSVRLRPEEESERRRLESMPGFLVLNSVRGIKPGATVLAGAVTETGDTVPALVEQRFGRGRATALLIGDLWRWGLHRPADAPDDQPKAWRQAIRRLVSDVPGRVEIAVAPRREPGDAEGTVAVSVRVRDAAFAPLDDGSVVVKVATPGGKTVDVPCDPTAREAGLYEGTYVAREPGAYRARATAIGPDGAELSQVEAGWTADPSAEEFHDLRANRALLDRIAKATGGETVLPDGLPRLANVLPTKGAAITEPYTNPLWHQPWVFALVIACLAAEWGLRRWRGLP